MDKKLHILQHLYGEAGDPEALRGLLEDPALREEYETLSAVKARLDRRERPRPDARVVDRIVAAAGPEPAARRRQDRPALPGRAARRARLIGTISAALAVVLVIGIGLVQVRTPRMADEAADKPAPLEQEAAGATADEGRAAPPEALEPPALELAARAEPARDAAAAPAPARARTEASPTVSRQNLAGASGGDTLPLWDEADELLRVHRRIEMLETRSPELTWDDGPVMSLDALPAENPAAPPGLNAVSKKREGANN